MTKVICVNRKRFEQGIGYGCWSVITITLLMFSIASVIEVNNTYEEDRGSYTYTCYQSVLFDTEKCYRYYSSDFEWNATILMIMLIINLAVVGYQIYSKQKKFKLSWCEKDD